MCGIAGILEFDADPALEGVVRRMTEALVHRGPDSSGVHVDSTVALGARRLSIIDLSDAAAQPLVSEDGEIVLVYNGETYNFRELRTELERAGHRFRSRTDGEVIVHGYEEWGEGVVERLSGMFAFALWDARRARLLLARDRYGIKPLYWTLRGRTLVFASEVKALLEHPRVNAELCYEALDEYLTFQNVLSDLTLFDGIRMLPAGCVATAAADEPAPRIRRYWDFGPRETAALDEADAADRLHALFGRAVERQLVSDVRVGSYLSGGLDSAFIAAEASRRIPRLTTFTGGFDTRSVSGLEVGFDERANAEGLANLLQTEHYEVVLHAGDMEWALPSLVWHLEDLRVGQSYPNLYVARLASRFVHVVLSGAGGDELFGGYPWRYQRVVGGDGDRIERLYRSWQRLVPDEDKALLFTGAAAGRTGSGRARDAFDAILAGWPAPVTTDAEAVAAALYFEQKTFLHGLLVVEDKLSMAHSLETRLPFLDDDLVEFALALPLQHKLRHLGAAPTADENVSGHQYLYERGSSDGKVILRRTLERVIPHEITQRIKQGFSAPDASWFRGESIDYVNKLLRSRDALIYEFLRPAYVERVLDEHCSGRVNRRLLIWSLLCLEWWCRCFLDGHVPETPVPAQARTSAA